MDRDEAILPVPWAADAPPGDSVSGRREPPVVRITARGLNRSTLGRQMLLRREPLGAAEAVRRVVALQAQHAASPYLALWNRLTDFDPADLDAAFADRVVVKATLMRITLHAVHAEDHRTFREAMDPTLRAARLDGRFLASGLTAADADALIPDLLDYADQARTASELEAWLGMRLGAPLHPGAWRGFRGYAPLLHAPARPRGRSVAARPMSRPRRGRRSRITTRPRRRCRRLSDATWRDSGRRRSRTWRSSPWCSEHGPARR
jgi:hypothetical protein